VNGLQHRAAAIRDAIRGHDRRYFVLNAPAIGDRAYDALVAELEGLEGTHPGLATADSPTRTVGESVLPGRPVVAHDVPMLSLSKSYDLDGVARFDRQVRRVLGTARVRYVLEPKVDGVACSLRYVDGRLAVAATRGDGCHGNDITAAVLATGAAPAEMAERVPGVLDVRGELFMDDRDFAALNRRLAAEGRPAIESPRGAAAGTVHLADPTGRRLRFRAYGVGRDDAGACPADYAAAVARVAALGLPVADGAVACGGGDELLRAVTAMAGRRPALGFAADGVVVKVDSGVHRCVLGATRRAPRWAFAFKW
jgi:DNA ligase (NAD+)